MSPEPPEPDRRPVVAHPDAVPLADSRGQDEAQALDVGGELHGRAQLLTVTRVHAETGVIVADAELATLPSDDERLHEPDCSRTPCQLGRA